MIANNDWSDGYDCEFTTLRNTIPKIIHHTAPTDINKWHPIWHRCLESWKTVFPESEYEYVMWNDKEDIDNLVEQYYPQYYELYQSFKFHIIKIDFARFCVLHLHGGIYADMDMYCYKNFYEELQDDVVMLEAAARDEILQNSLMASSKRNNFISYCMKEVEKLYYPYSDKLEMGHYVKDICGPYLLSRCYMTYHKKPQLLEASRYNPHHMTYQNNYVTRHMLTGLWGEETIKNFSREAGSEQNYSNYIKQVYRDFRKLDVNDLDFYHNYI